MFSILRHRSSPAGRGTRIGVPRNIRPLGSGLDARCDPPSLLDEEAARAGLSADEFDRGWLRAHLDEERRTASLWGVREAIFGVQDGLVSTLAVASTVAGASSSRSRSSSPPSRPAWPACSAWRPASTCGARARGRSLRRRSWASDRGGGAAWRGGGGGRLHARGGRPAAGRGSAVAEVLAAHPEVLLKTMVEKELGLTGDAAEVWAAAGARVMGIAFGPARWYRSSPTLVLSMSAATRLRAARRPAPLRHRRVEVALDPGADGSAPAWRSWAWAPLPGSPATCSGRSCRPSWACRARSDPPPRLRTGWDQSPAAR